MTYIVFSGMLMLYSVVSLIYYLAFVTGNVLQVLFLYIHRWISLHVSTVQVCCRFRHFVVQ